MPDPARPPHAFWQGFDAEAAALPYTDRFPAHLPDGRILHLPIRPLGDTGTALASLIINQASFAVEAALAEALAAALTEAEPDVVVGLPTLGLSLARAVAERLGHARYVPCSTSRKFWYDEALSSPMASVTSPDQTKRVYLDPRMLPLLVGRRVALIDDVISTGQSMMAGLSLLQTSGVEPVVLGAAMLQSRRWVAALSAVGMAARTCGVFETPLLRRTDGGWVADAPD